MPNKVESYKYGFERGFGKALGVCIGYLKRIDKGERNLDKIDIEEEMRVYALKHRKKNERQLGNKQLEATR